MYRLVCHCLWLQFVTRLWRRRQHSGGCALKAKWKSPCVNARAWVANIKQWETAGSLPRIWSNPYNHWSLVTSLLQRHFLNDRINLLSGTKFKLSEEKTSFYRFREEYLQFNHTECNYSNSPHYVSLWPAVVVSVSPQTHQLHSANVPVR